MAIGFVAGQATFFLLVFAIGISASDGETHSTVVDSIAVAVGTALLLTARHVRQHRSDPPIAPSPRAEAIHTRLANLHPATTLGTGVALGMGMVSPKRITVTLVVSATIAAAGLESAEAVALSVLYVAVATIVVWLPVLLDFALGPRATDWLANGQRWIARNKYPLTFYPSAVLGTVLVVDGIVRLVR